MTDCNLLRLHVKAFCPIVNAVKAKPYLLEMKKPKWKNKRVIEEATLVETDLRIKAILARDPTRKVRKKKLRGKITLCPFKYAAKSKL